MPKAGEYADMLRALGRFLDEQNAYETEVVEQQHYLAVSWQDSGGVAGQRSYNELDLNQLRAEARRLRGGGGSGPAMAKGERHELLRTLGQDLDAMGFSLGRILEDDEGFIVTGVSDRRYHSLRYTREALRELSAERRQQRGTVVPHPTEDIILESPEPNPSGPRWRFWRR